MRLPTATTPWYIELRQVDTPEKISLDLARHLPCRSAVGPVLVVTDRPTIALPVIRKRWVKIIREVERQRSSTLDRIKKESLQREAERLSSLTFAANTAYVAPPADIIFTSPEHAYTLQRYRTLYLVTLPAIRQLQTFLERLPPGNLIVSYMGWPADYDSAY